jgi:hypothetical protein
MSQCAGVRCLVDFLQEQYLKNISLHLIVGSTHSIAESTEVLLVAGKESCLKAHAENEVHIYFW